MKQDIRITIRTTIPTDIVEFVQAVERLSVKVTDIEIGQPYDREPERDGVG